MSLTLVDPSIVSGRRNVLPFARPAALHRPRTFQPATRLVLYGSSCILALCVLIFTVNTIHWPLAGDASLMHYVVFLMEHGKAPYRDIADINFPGSYLIDYTVMYTLGGGSLAWRCFDLLLLLFSTLAMIAIARPYGWFAGIFAGSLLTTIHGADGIYQLGQRDLVIAALLLIGYAALFQATRNQFAMWMMIFGLCSGIATMIKPTFVLFGVTTMVWMLIVRRREQKPYRAFIVWGLTGWGVPILGTLVFLWGTHALSAFISTVQGIVLLHATLGRKPLTFLSLHSFSPLMPLVCLWICCSLCRREQWKSWEGGALLIGVLYGLLSYVAQGKGYPYQRYPFLALLLLVMSIDFTHALKGGIRVRAAGWTAVAFGTLFLAPVSVLKASHYAWRNTEFSTMLQGDLYRLGGADLSGHVQCVDSTSGCFDVLYTMRLVQADGFMYDEFLFREGGSEVIAESRRRLWTAIIANPPKLFVVTDASFPDGPGDFKKLGDWPEFASYLQRNYLLCSQKTPPDPVRWWSRTQPPHSYRVYCANAHT
jgi:hypothetical protein